MALETFIRKNPANASRLNALLRGSNFERAPDGKPWQVAQILFGPKTAAVRLQLARAAGLFKAAHVVGSNGPQVEPSKPSKVISSTTFFKDDATVALEKFIGENKANAQHLNALLADSKEFGLAPDGKPWLVGAILFGPEKAKAALRLKLAKAAGLLPP